jgi:hypothetical protein
VVLRARDAQKLAQAKHAVEGKLERVRRAQFALSRRKQGPDALLLTALQPFFHCCKSLEGSFYLKPHLFFLRHPSALGLNMRPSRISPVLL